MEKIKKAGLLFSGGPAPSANSVISSVALNFINAGIEVIGFLRGLEYLEKYGCSLIEGEHYLKINRTISHIRNERGVFLKTSRANPGKDIREEKDLEDEKRSRNLRNIADCLKEFDIDLLITIGGDDTLKTANYLSIIGVRVIHVPKTIDNDYNGIAWTFGYWSAVETAKNILLNLKADGRSTDAYFIAELMGRKAGWLTYGAGIAGEAAMMISTEDLADDEELDMDRLADEIVDFIIMRERQSKFHGVIAVAEGLADRLPDSQRPVEKDRHGNIRFGTVEVGRLIKDRVIANYKERTGKAKKVLFKQVGYETRNAEPVSFDVVLGSMLGYGVFKLAREGQSGIMVSVTDNFTICSIDFSELVDTETLKTVLRNVPKEGDFFRLKNALSYRDD